MIKLFASILLLFFSFNLIQSSGFINSKLTAEDQLILKVKIIGVKDGDTVEVLYYQLPFTVRLEHIDAPEKKQAFGTVSKQKLASLCYGKTITLISKKKKGNYDRNGRMIAELFLENGISINKEMVKAGLAWHYKYYSKDKIYAALEIAARKNKIGLWQDKKVVAPWEFRK